MQVNPIFSRNMSMQEVQSSAARKQDIATTPTTGLGPSARPIQPWSKLRLGVGKVAKLPAVAFLEIRDVNPLPVHRTFQWELTTQSTSSLGTGTSLPSSTLGGQGSFNTFSITFTIPCVRISTLQPECVTVSYTIDRPRWHLGFDDLSSAYYRT